MSELLISDGESSSLLPTPSAVSYGSNKGGGAGRVGKERPSLQTLAKRGMLPTPRATMWKDYGGPGEKSERGQSIPAALRDMGMLATPTAKGNQFSPEMQRKWAGCRALRAVHPPGPLHPKFVEWMMGFPDEWTACEPSETPSSPSVRKSSDTSSRS
jgi:hypothetical protein